MLISSSRNGTHAETRFLDGIFSSEFNLRDLLSVRQEWTPGERYSYLETPRRCDGLIYFTDSSAVLEWPDRTRQTVTAGEIVFLSRGAHYAVTFPSHTLSHTILINFTVTDEMGVGIDTGGRAVRLCRDDGTLLPLFSAAARSYRTEPPARLKAAVFAVFAALFPLEETDECCISFINRHYTERFSIPELARKSAMNQSAYRRRFYELTGVSPVRYINRLKIEKACRMLRGGDVTPAEISAFLHFYSVPYFYKVFRDLTGQTPLEYRQSAPIDGIRPHQRKKREQPPSGS